MKRTLVLGIVLVLALLVFAHVSLYPTGIVTDLPFGHSCGIEFHPTPGFFCDTD